MCSEYMEGADVVVIFANTGLSLGIIYLYLKEKSWMEIY